MDLEFYASLGLECILYGVYSVLFISSLYLLLFHRRRGAAQRLVHHYVLIATVIMYSVSTTHLVLSFRVFSDSFLNGNNWDPNTPGTDALCIAKMYLPAINFMLADLIVIWRLYLLWNFNVWVCVPPLFLVLATGVTAIAGTTQAAAHMHTIVLDAHYPWTLALNCLTLATNVVTTALVAYRARWYNRSSIQDRRSEARKLSQEILATIVESGFLYCFTWVICFIVYWSRTHGNFLIADNIPQLTGIYSSLIILLVALKMTQLDSIALLSHDGRADPETRGTMNRTVLQTAPLELRNISTHTSPHSTKPMVVHVMTSVEESGDRDRGCTPNSSHRVHPYSRPYDVAKD
ncbi:uncharacterized protein STEHIDRAFT_122649 [Stereum hirsutum FP-91666 SS1]|uniref:uncharacterized protein n=1 Tax=Stereum hirsutum (strain FP-91666) TaxID=721885 RepID=UPI000444996F|nr:uncharacterized protein STEHIDRAFT_122649 [Stereum hirsutum FP-91666 SS1]EIM85722.1 hypothetical protein STEHIDRAFT_122649 [Stereum hirsutum FP-91666 SS1]